MPLKESVESYQTKWWAFQGRGTKRALCIFETRKDYEKLLVKTVLQGQNVLPGVPSIPMPVGADAARCSTILESLTAAPKSVECAALYSFEVKANALSLTSTKFAAHDQDVLEVLRTAIVKATRGATTGAQGENEGRRAKLTSHLSQTFASTTLSGIAAGWRAQPQQQQKQQQQKQQPFAKATQARSIRLKGLESSDLQHDKMGVYELVEGKEVNGRGVWRKEGERGVTGDTAFIYYNKSKMWFIHDRASMELGKATGWMYISSDALTPDRATGNWSVSAGLRTRWYPAPKVEVCVCTLEQSLDAPPKTHHLSQTHFSTSKEETPMKPMKPKKPMKPAVTPTTPEVEIELERIESHGLEPEAEPETLSAESDDDGTTMGPRERRRWGALSDVLGQDAVCQAVLSPVPDLLC
jgi:hypothetical protein